MLEVNVILPNNGEAKQKRNTLDSLCMIVCSTIAPTLLNRFLKKGLGDIGYIDFNKSLNY